MNAPAKTVLLTLLGSSAGALISHIAVTQWPSMSWSSRDAGQEPPITQAWQHVVQTPTLARAISSDALPPKSSGAATETQSDAVVAPTAKGHEPRLYGGPETSRVKLRAKLDSWVQVRGPDGELIFARVLRPGDVYRVPDTAGLRLVTGNAGGLIALVDGVERSLGQVGQVIRDVSLSPQTFGQIVPATSRPSDGQVTSTPTFQDLLLPSSNCRTWNAASRETRWQFIENTARQVSSLIGRDSTVTSPYLEGCLRKIFEEPCIVESISVPEAAASCVALARR
jgi:hypothetical protein